MNKNKYISALIFYILISLFSPDCAISAEPIIGAIAPHHNVASPLNEELYSRISSISPHPSRIVLIGPDHLGRAKRNIVCCAAPWDTDFGTLRPDTEGARMLGSSAARHDAIFPLDHAITEHIPFIRRYFGDVPVLPILIRSPASGLQLLRARCALQNILKEGGIVILSMDFSHYKPRDESDAEDERSIEVLRAFRINEIDSLDVDTKKGARLFAALLKSMGVTESELLGRSNSADYIPKSAMSSTGHVTLLFTQGNP